MNNSDVATSMLTQLKKFNYLASQNLDRIYIDIYANLYG